MCVCVNVCVYGVCVCVCVASCNNIIKAHFSVLANLCILRAYYVGYKLQANLAWSLLWCS